MQGKKIMWVDDEIDLLRSHILFLEQKGFSVTAVSSGNEAVRVLGADRYDIVLLDETMPGMSGLEILQKIKEIDPNIPIVMITKNDAEDLMDNAIGMKIDDYLLKPVNPLQIYSATKRILDAHRIQETAVSKDYLQVYQRVDQAVARISGWEEWAKIHAELSGWDLEFDRFSETGLGQTHDDLRKNCNTHFGRMVEQSYRDWVHSDKRPVMSPDVLRKFVFHHIDSKQNVYFIVIDCMRYDQWLTIEDLIAPYFQVERDYYYSILPTATPYSRNAIFAGLFPQEIEQRFQKYWLEKSKDEFSKNRYESELLSQQLAAAGMKGISPKYLKIYEADEANELRKQVDSYRSIPFVVMVFNFLDILSHGRSQSDILQEIAPNESAFRSLMRSWFSHSALFEILQKISKQRATVVITTDHGSILGQKASLVHGNRDTSTNLRYKFGENLNGDPKQALLVKKPSEFRLPAESPSKNYILAKENYYFVYPTNYHEYEKQYLGTFQHGGISLEEMIVPCLTLTAK
jgi:CheY-like chemotaxis protein